MVYRNQSETIIIYEYQPEIFQIVQEEAPLQFSFTLLHEFLWDILDDIRLVREVNRLIHSKLADTYTSQELQEALRKIGLLKKNNSRDLIFCNPSSSLMPNSEFLREVEYGNFDHVTYWLSNGACVNAKTSSGYSAIVLAAKNGHQEIFYLLLDHGAYLMGADKNGNDLLYHLVDNNRDKLLKRVVTEMNQDETIQLDFQTALFTSFRFGCLTCFKEMLNLNVLQRESVRAQLIEWLDSKLFTISADRSCQKFTTLLNFDGLNPSIESDFKKFMAQHLEKNLSERREYVYSDEIDCYMNLAQTEEEFSVLTGSNILSIILTDSSYQRHDVEKIIHLHERGIPLDQVNQHGDTLFHQLLFKIHWYKSFDSKYQVEKLLPFGVSPNSLNNSGLTPLDTLVLAMAKKAKKNRQRGEFFLSFYKFLLAKGFEHVQATHERYHTIVNSFDPYPYRFSGYLLDVKLAIAVQLRVSMIGLDEEEENPWKTNEKWLGGGVLVGLNAGAVGLALSGAKITIKSKTQSIYGKYCLEKRFEQGFVFYGISKLTFVKIDMESKTNGHTFITLNSIDLGAYWGGFKNNDQCFFLLAPIFEINK